MELTITEREQPPFHVVTVDGEIDVYTAPKFREVIVGAIESGNTRLIVDIESVDFLDSTGLGVLVGALKKVRASNGSLDIVCTSDRLLRIFAITGLDKVFGIKSSLAEVIS
ncbi:MAG TPA: STAS domain-containing protein [Aeromicrobium sp.]|nr:STAS domain-containing protein [Aeromicrobium sp.]